MSGGGDAGAQAAWIARVLGVQLPRQDAPGSPSLAQAVQAWRDASEVVDGQIGALQAALRASDDDELKDIGAFGLNAVTGNFKVPLMAALMGAEAGREGDRQKLAGLAASMRQHLESSEKVEACDENPFGVAVSIRATLIPALEQLERGAA